MIFFVFQSIEEEAKALVLSTGVVESLRSTCEASNVVTRLQESLELNQAALKDPGPETTRLIRSLAVIAKNENRLDVVKHLREITPAGTTGVSLFVSYYSCKAKIFGNTCEYVSFCVARLYANC